MNRIQLSLLLLAVFATACFADNAVVCTEAQGNACHRLANCEGGVCMCSEGLIGDGIGADGCKTDGWTVRQVYTCTSATTFQAVDVSGTESSVLVYKEDGVFVYAVNHLFAEPLDADAAIAVVDGLVLTNGCVCEIKESGTTTCDARKYAYVAQTTGAPTNVLPTGLTVDTVAFSSVCSASADGNLAAGSGSGCWVIGVTYTTGGPDAISTIYFPNVISTDLTIDNAPSVDEDDSFLPTNFPVDQPNGRTTGLPTFATNYNLLTAAKTWASAFDATTAVNVSQASADHYVTGEYPGLALSPGVVSTTTLDPFFYMYSAVIEIEETDMRSKAGIRKGTVGVEYTVDSFVGFANFKPTGVLSLDTMVSQTAIHVEKTNFFSVSTHGTNDYTFLEYVNLRLVMVYNSDTDNADTSTNDELRTDPAGNFAYVQVTFTLGAQYQPNTGGLIPFDSVRTAKGTFYSDVQASMDHSCLLFNADATTLPDTDLSNGDITGMLAQDCGPGTTMCAATTANIADQFVSFNIPLGEEYFTDEATTDLSQNVFVSMVIDAIDQDTIDGMGNPNGGDAAEQMKTTLTASIPIVDGGVNIFCDGVTAKTDLKDVVNATLIIGTASSEAELDRLTIFTDIANTEGSAGDVPLITTSSIESGFMTLVIQGQQAYFTNNGTEAGYGLEVEDVITVHVMEDGSTKLDAIVDLLEEDPQDNQVGGALDVDGYPLNGAFFFEIDRLTNRAHLQPTTGLLAMCPFNPTRPTSWSCVTRRDIKDRAFPKRVGGHSTAMEMSVTLNAYTDERNFMATVLGDSDFAVDLAESYAGVIHNEYLASPAGSAGRYQRAYWINPSYEWTPTQTGGESIFTLSQGIVMFALVTLNENWAISTLSPDLPDSTSSGARRRALLTASKSDEGSGASSQVYKTSTDSNKVLLAAMGDDIKQYATFDLTVRLTAAEACLTDDELIDAMITKFKSSVLTEDSSVSTASAVTITQIISKDIGTVVCSGRRLRNLLALSDATVKLTAAVGFKDASNMVLNLETLENNDESVTVAASNMVPDGLKLDGKTYQDGKAVQDKTPSGNTVKDSTASATSMSPGLFAAILVALSALVAA